MQRFRPKNDRCIAKPVRIRYKQYLDGAILRRRCVKTILYLILAAALIGGAWWFGLFNGLGPLDKTLKYVQNFTKSAEDSWRRDDNRSRR
jgi:hypothetical protein